MSINPKVLGIIPWIVMTKTRLLFFFFFCIHFSVSCTSYANLLDPLKWTTEAPLISGSQAMDDEKQCFAQVTKSPKGSIVFGIKINIKHFGPFQY